MLSVDLPAAAAATVGARKPQNAAVMRLSTEWTGCRRGRVRRSNRLACQPQSYLRIFVNSRQEKRKPSLYADIKMSEFLSCRPQLLGPRGISCELMMARRRTPSCGEHRVRPHERSQLCSTVIATAEAATAPGNSTNPAAARLAAAAAVAGAAAAAVGRATAACNARPEFSLPIYAQQHNLESLLRAHERWPSGALTYGLTLI